MTEQNTVETANQIIALATEHSLRVTSVESVTGGRVASALTAISGAGNVFFAGGVFYNTAAKIRFLNIPAAFFDAHSVYSPECAREMAERWKTQTEADFCIATTGEAETSDDQESGRVFFAVASLKGVETADVVFLGDRESIQNQSTAFALRFLLSVMNRKLPK